MNCYNEFKFNEFGMSNPFHSKSVVVLAWR